MKTQLTRLSFAMGLLFLGCNLQLKTPEFKSVKLIHPPLLHATVKNVNYRVDAKKGGVIQYPSGTLINIPAEAFVDRSGNPINDTVDISYREMHKLSEIFVSGIPMTYDSAGTEYHFESAGMTQIMAHKNGNPVFIGKDKAIDINMKSTSADPKFNLYYYDTTQNQWVNKGKDITVTVDTSNLEKPEKPLMVNENNQCFSINADYREFPELKVFSNTLFQVIDTQKINPAYFNTLWYDCSIEKGVRKGTYRVSFGGYDEKTTFTVVPVYDRKNIANAMAYYEKKFDNYKQKLLSEIAKEKKINEAKKLKAKNEINALLEKYSKEDNAQEKLETQQEINRLKYDTLMREQRRSQVQMFSRLEDERMADKINNAIYRSFSIRQFGVYNCDCPAILPMGADVVASFVDSAGRPLQLKQVSLIELTKKMMFTIYPYNFNHFKFNPSDDNMICGVTDDYKFVYFTNKDFKKVKKSGDYTFKMRTSEAEIESSEDIDEILALY